jgi:hypothetical protein
MPRNNRTGARTEQAEVEQHADRTADRETAAMLDKLAEHPEISDAMDDALPGSSPPAEDERETIGLGLLTEMMQQLPNPADLLSKAVTDGFKQAAHDHYVHTLRLAPFDVERRALAYEYDGRVIVRTHGRLMQSMARDMLTQAFYSCRTAHREVARWRRMDLVLREQRQVDYAKSRPGQAEEAVADAPWLDGDDRFDPTKQAAQRAEDAMMEACAYVALAFTYGTRVPKATDGEPITARVKMRSQPQQQATPVQTAADRLRSAGAWVGANAGPQQGPAEPTGDPEHQQAA